MCIIEFSVADIPSYLVRLLFNATPVIDENGRLIGIIPATEEDCDKHEQR